MAPNGNSDNCCFTAFKMLLCLLVTLQIILVFILIWAFLDRKEKIIANVSAYGFWLGMIFLITVLVAQVSLMVFIIMENLVGLVAMFVAMLLSLLLGLMHLLKSDDKIQEGSIFRLYSIVGLTGGTVQWILLVIYACCIKKVRVEILMFKCESSRIKSNLKVVSLKLHPIAPEKAVTMPRARRRLSLTLICPRPAKYWPTFPDSSSSSLTSWRFSVRYSTC